MTSDAGGYRSPGTTGTTYPPPLTVDEGETSTTDVAKDQASNVAQTAKDAGSQVASTAGEQARQLAGEAKYQARNLASEASGQAKQQADSQKQRAAGNLRSLSDELRSMADQGGQSGLATDLARQGSQATRDLAEWLDARDPGQLLEEVRSFARRKPGAFLLGCVAAGVVAGRLTRGAVAAAKSDGGDGQYGGSQYGTGEYGSQYGIGQYGTGQYGTGQYAEPTSYAGTSTSVAPGGTTEFAAPETPGRHTAETDPLTAPLTVEEEERQSGQYGFASGESR